MSVSIQTRTGVMRIQNADQSIFQNFTEEELVAIMYALDDRAVALSSVSTADPAYIKFLQVIGEKITSMVDADC